MGVTVLVAWECIPFTPWCKLISSSSAADPVLMITVTSEMIVIILDSFIGVLLLTERKLPCPATLHASA